MKRLATLAILIAIVGSNVFADAKPGGIAREISMGGSLAGSGVILNPFIMEDPTLMLLNPAYQTLYKDYVWANIGGGTLNGLSTADNGYGKQFAGVNFGLTKQFALGVTLSYDPSAVNLIGSQIPALGAGAGVYQRAPQTIPTVANVYELVGSYGLSGLDLGFGFMYGSSNNKTEVSGAATGKSDAHATMFGFRAGAIADLGSGSSLDGSIQLRFDSYADEITAGANTNGKYSASATEIIALLRAKFKISNKFNFVPYGAFATASTEPKEDTPPTGVPATTHGLKFTAMAFAIGVGGEFKANDFYLAGGVSMQYAKLKSEFSNSAATTENFDSTMSTMALPVFNLGAEWWFVDWMAGRLGYYRSLASVTLKGEHSGANFTVQHDYSNPNSLLIIPGGLGFVPDGSLITLGLGLRFGGFALDATVSEEALRRGLGLVGGSDNINSFGYITTSVNFE